MERALFLTCTTGNPRMVAVRELPVVPICRRQARLCRRANQKHLPAHPASARGAFRPIVTTREAGCDGRDDVTRIYLRWTTGVVADGEVVWS